MVVEAGCHDTARQFDGVVPPDGRDPFGQRRRLAVARRIVVELVRSFARQWVPAGPSAVALELIFTATDPPVKLLRRVIPVVRIGGVGLDLSIMVLLLVVFILMNVAQPTP